MNLTHNDIEVLENWWIEKSRVNFFAYRQFIRYGNFKHNWFISDLSRRLQQFYIDLKAGKKPTLVIQTPPQHGKSWAVTDLISFIIGHDPWLRIIYASFSDRLSTRCNNAIQRTMDSIKYNKIFPKTRIPVRGSRANIRNSELIELLNENQVTDGYFRNTTVGGAVTGESFDVGIIDDPFKGREQANSPTYREKVWDWFTNDFTTRMSEEAGLLIIMTRWHKQDLVGKLKEEDSNITVLNYPAIATHDEVNRREGEALFPELKSLEFLKKKRKLLHSPHWQSLYQGSPVVIGGELFKDDHWNWWEKLPPLKYKFIVVDTAQKVKTINDWTCFQCWGYGINGCIYLLDQLHAKLESPELRTEAEIFYNKHNTPRLNVGDPVLRGMYIEDKSSGSGLIQELRRKKVKVVAVQRNTDKVFRSQDVIPEIESGKVYLNKAVPKVGTITNESREFPNGEFDDAIDTTMSAIEVAYLDKDLSNLLQAATEAD